jgi:hypothetical protein
MDLELALGRPIGPMSERNFARWNSYAIKKALPLRRLEYGLAQIALLIATSNGAEGATLQDYLFDPAVEGETREPTEDEMTAIFGPRKRGQGDG